MQSIEYLRKYHKDVQFITGGYAEIDAIPNEWKIALGMPDEAKKKYIIDFWKKDFSDLLCNLISYLEKNLVSVDLIQYRDRYSLLYGISSTAGRTLYYEGMVPLSVDTKPNPIKDWERFPEKIKRFYTSLHNGFFYYASHSMGLSPVNEIFLFDDEDWHILEELAEPIQIDLENTYGIFASGMGGYVAVDLCNCENDNSVIWFTAKQPIYNKNFWSVVDEWTVLGFEE